MSKVIELMKDFLFFISHPNYWVMNYQYSEEWDKKLNELMAEHLFIAVDNFTTSLNGVSIWIENHPYASFKLYPTGSLFRPSRRTIDRAYKRFLADTLTTQLTLSQTEYLERMNRK